MPKIKTYNAPSRANPVETEDKGMNAWETAGRHLAPLYASAGEDFRAIGKFATQQLDTLDDILKDRSAKTGTGSSGTTSASDKWSFNFGGGGKSRSGGGTGGGGRTRDYGDTAAETSGVAASAVKKGGPTEENVDKLKGWYYDKEGKLIDYNKAANEAADKAYTKAGEDQKKNSPSDEVQKDVARDPDAFKGVIKELAPDKQEPTGFFGTIGKVIGNAYTGITTNTSPTSSEASE